MTDREIVDLYFRRSETAVKETKIKYGRLIRSIFINICGADGDVDECVSDTLMALWNAIPPLRPDSFSAYLSKVARNISVNRLKRGRSGPVPLCLEELGECVPGPSDLQREAETGEIGEIINRFLGKLPKRSRGIFIKRYFYGCGIKEIADFYDMKENAVKQLLFRLRAKLKNSLEKEGYGV